jgi:hypothetical protein
MTVRWPALALARGASVIVLALLALGGCASDTGPSSATLKPGDTSSSGLVLSRYAYCNQQGEWLASYLATGQPYSMDPAYGPTRQRVLAIGTREGRELAIRQFADQAIQTCVTEKTRAIDDFGLGCTRAGFKWVAASQDKLVDGGHTIVYGTCDGDPISYPGPGTTQPCVKCVSKPEPCSNGGRCP